jgi:DNA-binding transcriptional LysR family regulator
VSPTPAVAVARPRIIDKARKIPRMTENIGEDFLGEGSEAGTGHVRIASVPSIAAQLVPHLVETVVEEFPGIRIEIFDGCREHSEIARMVRAGDADLGIAQPHGDENLLVFPFVYDALIAVVPPIAPVSSPLCWSDLCNFPLILQSRSNGQ